MIKWSVIFPLIAIIATFLVGCSGSGSEPISPGLHQAITTGSSAQNSNSFSSVNLWGFYDVFIDPETMQAHVDLNRSAMFTANCTNLLNHSVGSGISIDINSIDNLPDYIDFDLVITIIHPYPGLPQFNGYDVRGVFMGNGSGMMAYNSDLTYPVDGIDQGFQPGLAGDSGLPDGYTRWFNYTEFSGGVMPLFEYTPGNNASSAFDGTATLCPYKYFADTLGDYESVTEWLQDHPENHGVFSSSASNSRNYKIRFPKSIPLKFGYAVIANWEGKEPEQHPSNAPEAVACNSEQAGSVYFVDPTSWGGNIELTLDIYEWGAHALSGAMEDYTIRIESDAMTSVYEFTSTDMTPIGGAENYSTYFADIIPDALTSVVGHEYWIIVECADYDYSNEFGVMNDAWDDPLAAFFRYDLEVSDTNPTTPPVCDLTVDPCSVHYWDITDHAIVMFDASGSYDPDGDDITFHWDFDGDDIYDEPGDDDYTGDPDHPVHNYYENGICNLKVVDEYGAFSICTVDVDITGHQSKNIPLRDGWEARDLAVDPDNGDLHVLYYRMNGGGNWTETMKYSPCDCYTEPPDPFFVCMEGAGSHCIDVSATHYSMIGGWFEMCSGKVFNIDPDGVFVGPFNHVSRAIDVWIFNDGGLWPYDHNHIYGWFSPPWNPNGHSSHSYRRSIADFSINNQTSVNYWGPGETWTGHDKLFGNYIVAVEPVAYGNSFWVLKESYEPDHPDSWGTRWLIDQPATFTGIEYDGAWFGTGIPDDSDDSWNDAKDLTRDVDDNLLVLDQLSDGTGRIKAFIGDDSGGAPLAAMNINDEINGTPLRLDSSDYLDLIYGNLLYVLHGDSTDGYYLSIYFTDETPW